ncbi:MAG: protein-L-isoaspartate(D-aspartate) O-methyltransferase [Bacteroidales bacterium]|nr:protein-L-isoaspartate(D-aspartate) O-methyltransferase [Bacteroidales bacterium]
MFLNFNFPVKFLFILLILFFQCSGQVSQVKDFEYQRKMMVKKQIEWRGINNNKILNAMRKVPRHKFIPEIYQEYAYEDTPLPIGDGQTISQPYIVAFMTDALNLNAKDKVLEIGTGSGYQAAILAEICDTVYTIEIFKSLGENAETVLKDLDYKNIFFKIGDGYNGWEKHSPFDAIIVTCAPTDIPKPLEEQLNEGGRMIIPVGKESVQKLVLIKKKNGKLYQDAVLPVRFVPMINEKGKKY